MRRPTDDESRLIKASQNERERIQNELIRVKRNKRLATVVVSTVVIMTLMGFVMMWILEWERTASNLVDKVTGSDLKNLPSDIDELKDYPRLAEGLLDKKLKAVAYRARA